MPEPTITINGHLLEAAHAMTIRAAIECFASELADPGALGDDDHARIMRDGYRARITEIRAMIFQPHPVRFEFQQHKVAEPCMDCVDGYCTMNCGPSVPPKGK